MGDGPRNGALLRENGDDDDDKNESPPASPSLPAPPSRGVTDDIAAAPEDHPRNKLGLLLLLETSHAWPEQTPRFRNDDDEEEYVGADAAEPEAGAASQGFPAMWKAVGEDCVVLSA